MIRRPPRSTRTDTLPTRRSSDLPQDEERHPMDKQITHDPAYETVDPDNFAAMLEVPRYGRRTAAFDKIRSEEHTSELQSLMRISYAVFCLKKKKNTSERQATTKAKKT